MKAWLFALPMVIALPVSAHAQDSEADNARAAELQCQLAGICGELAESEADREKEAIDGVDTRAMLTIGQVMAARKSGAQQPTSTRKVVTTPRVDPSSTTQITRQGGAKRTIAAPGRRLAAPVVKKAVPVGSAADVPDSLDRRAPLFVTFGLNSAKLTRESSVEVASFAKALKTIAASGIDKRYRIEGHTDASGDAANNRKLSQARAEAVRDALVMAGVEGSRIEVAGFGSDQPIAGYAAGDPINRRVEAVEIR